MKQAIIKLTAAVRELAAAIKEGKEENSPTPPYKKKPQETNNNNKNACAREVPQETPEPFCYVMGTVEAKTFLYCWRGDDRTR